MRLVLFCSEKVCQLRIYFSAIINAQEFSGKEKGTFLIYENKRTKKENSIYIFNYELLFSDG